MGFDLLNRIVLRWDSDSNCAPFLETGGIEVVLLRTSDDRVAAACRAAGAQTLPAAAIRLIGLEGAGRVGPGALVAVKAGVWPGAQATSRTAGGGFSAGASQRAWVNANGYLPALLRALYPGLAPVLGYLPDSDAGISAGTMIAYDSLELALIDAWAGGGNYILTPDAALRDALASGDAAAREAWQQMGRTAGWLKEQQALFRQPPLPAITVLVEPGETTAEIAALMFRQSVSPELVAATRIPAPDPLRRPVVVVAAGIRPPGPEARKLLVSHAHAGATVVTDTEPGEWWQVPGLKRVREFEDREFYALGAGRVVAYKQAVLDPGDFALDVLDLAGERRPVRIWDSPAGVATVSQAGPRAKPVLRVVNYGSAARADVMAHVRGVFSSATLLRPDGQARPLRTYRRGQTTEVMLPGLKRVALVLFN
ncbi:MAG TPA: hypothetical protein VME43_28795 [Bryobacteraceae bacterium]|nr:hypothetical protein [Bryobacteraceae bacterium]